MLYKVEHIGYYVAGKEIKKKKKDLIARINDSNSWWLQVIFLKTCILDVINDLVFKRFKHSIKCVIFLNISGSR